MPALNSFRALHCLQHAPDPNMWVHWPGSSKLCCYHSEQGMHMCTPQAAAYRLLASTSLPSVTASNAGPMALSLNNNMDFDMQERHSGVFPFYLLRQHRYLPSNIGST